MNTYTQNDQRDPEVAVDAAGNFVIVWQSGGGSGGDNSGTSVQSQRYDAAGNPVGTETQVNTYTTSEQRSN